MIFKVISEIIISYALLTLSSGFWNCIKSPKYLAITLGDYEFLKKMYHTLGKETIKQESDKLNPKVGYSLNIVFWIKASISALDQTRNTLLILIIGILIGSGYLGMIFFFINVSLFFLMCFRPIISSAKTNILSDVRMIMLNVYKWNESDHNECKIFCNEEQPRMLKNIYKIISEE